MYPTVTPTLTVGGTFSAGDYVGTSGTAMEFTNCGKDISASGGAASGYILGAELIDGALQSKSGELWIFGGTIAPPTDNAAWSISDDDAKKLVAVIPFSTYYASALNSVSFGQPDGGPARYITAAGSKSLYGCFVTRDAPVYPDGALTFKLTIAPD